MTQWPEQVNSIIPDDRALLTALCQRQPTALAMLYDRYSRLV
ncbi:MAG: hypothetical protein VKJ24_17955 [Synechococcales bacterium]|nr:hypothetical protein [Synechococcales bacterium]